jgi:hypothetical protein
VSALALTRARPGAGESGRPQPASSLFDDLGGEPTLDELLVGVWEGLAVHRSQVCPACGGEMEPVYGAHTRPLGGRCTSCGTKLA